MPNCSSVHLDVFIQSPGIHATRPPPPPHPSHRCSNVCGSLRGKRRLTLLYMLFWGPKEPSKMNAYLAFAAKQWAAVGPDGAQNMLPRFPYISRLLAICMCSV